MNIIVVSNRRGLHRMLDLKRPRHVLVFMGLLALPVISLVFAGYAAAQYLGDAGVRSAAREFRQELADQSQQIEAAKQKTLEDLDALGKRVGDIRAHVIRLDALGRRLVQMASLDEGEFDFDQTPAQGGPEPQEASLSVDATDFISVLDGLTSTLNDRQRQLRVLEDFMLSRKLRDQVHPEGRPVDSGWISSYFGRRSDPFSGRMAHHGGIDFAGREGSQIKSVAAGVVSYSGKRYGYGNLVEINHGNGYFTRYGHNAENLVQKGDTVERGQVVALMGHTGRATGAHLHFEVLKGGRSVNPLEFIAARAD